MTHQKNVIFAGVRAAMKNRFTTATNTTTNTTTTTTLETTIAKDKPESEDRNLDTNKNENNNNNNAEQEPEPSIVDYTITRTIHRTFHPESLLCKRFNIPVPVHHSRKGDHQESTTYQSREESYFYNDIMKEAMNQTMTTIETNPTNSVTHHESHQQSTVSDPNHHLPPLSSLLFLDEFNAAAPAPPERPSLGVYQSIFDTLPESLMDQNTDMVEHVRTGKNDTIVDESVDDHRPLSDLATSTSAPPLRYNDYHSKPLLLQQPLIATITSDVNNIVEQTNSDTRPHALVRHRRDENDSHSTSSTSSSLDRKYRRKHSKKHKKKETKHKKKHKKTRKHKKSDWMMTSVFLYVTTKSIFTFW